MNTKREELVVIIQRLIFRTHLTVDDFKNGFLDTREMKDKLTELSAEAVVKIEELYNENS